MQCPELPAGTGKLALSHRGGDCGAPAFALRKVRPRAWFRRLARAGLCAAIGFAAGGVSADETAAWRPVDSATLDSARGGFTLGSGLVLSFGIERLVSVNGDVVARSSLELPDLSRLGSGLARQTEASLSSVKLIQNGHDNIFVGTTAAPSLGGLVIQNSLNGQAIQSQTVISASVNSLSLLKTLNFQHSVGEAVARSANPY